MKHWNERQYRRITFSRAYPGQSIVVVLIYHGRVLISQYVDNYVMNADADVIIELWKYDPVLLSRDGMVDPLSLVMSFEDNEDERM